MESFHFGSTDPKVEHRDVLILEQIGNLILQGVCYSHSSLATDASIVSCLRILERVLANACVK